MKAQIRKLLTVVDETLTEQGQEILPAIRRAAAIAVIANPFAGKYQEDLSVLIDIGEELVYDYAYILAERHTPAAKKRYPCRCGAITCRGTILGKKR